MFVQGLLSESFTKIRASSGILLDLAPIINDRVLKLQYTIIPVLVCEIFG